MGKKFLITGFGFIGRRVAEILCERSLNVTALERHPDLAALRELGLGLVLGDVRDAQLLSQVVPEFDGVIHTAALLGTSELLEDPGSAMATNVMGALNVFQALRRAAKLGRPVPCVHITCANYFMNNAYSISKHTADRFAEMFNVEHGTDIRIVRAQNVYGERQKHYPVQKIIPKFAHAALRNEPITVYGDGRQVQDMIYVGDVARILAAALEAGRNPGLLSAGSGRATTVREIAELVIRATHSRSELCFVPMRPGEPPGSVVLGEPETLRAVGIGPECLTPFEEGIARTVAWYRDNPEYLA